MKETKAFFIIKKYRSILRSAIIVETVSFIVSLTDGIIAGHKLGTEAFTAIGLIAPFLSISTFLSSIVNTGTVMNYSYQVGKFNRHRADEFFSQGIITALLMGLFYSIGLLLLGPAIISTVSPQGEIRPLLDEYYDIMLAFFFLQPISYLLDNLLVADGGEQLSLVANVVMIVSNVVGSLVLVDFWGIKGIAFASFLSRSLLILIICSHFFSKKSNLRFVRYWNITDIFMIFKGGIVKASTYGLEALLNYSINLFALRHFETDTLVILVVIEKFMGLMTLFIGLSMACQPVISTLQGEKNTKGQRQLMLTVLKDMTIISAALTLLTQLGAPIIVASFGISEKEHLFTESVAALRIVSFSLILQSVLVLFFIYYVFINKQLLAFVICLIKNFVSPAVIAVVLSLMLGSRIGIWLGIGIAPILAFIVSAFIVLLKYDRRLFPFLIQEDPEQKILIYDFKVSNENAVNMSMTIREVLEQHSVSSKICMTVSVITEDVLMLIQEKNRNSKKPIHAECTIMIRPDCIKLILRDSGIIFNITDTDSSIGSFRQFFVSNLMLNQKEKFYLVTTGYNRSELFFYL